MHTIPPRQRATLARRIAAGLPVWAAARGSNLPKEAVGELMWEPEFRELIGAWAEILDMEPEARKKRLLLLAATVIEEKLEAGCGRTAFFVQREYRRHRDPAATLAKGFSQLVELERAKAECHERLAAAAPAAPESAAAPADPTPLEAATADAEVARRIPPLAHPDDRALWRQAGQLRHDMLGEQVLHHAVVRKAMLDRLLGPPSVVDAPPEPEAEPEEAPEAPPAPEPPPLNRQQRRRLGKKLKAGRIGKEQRPGGGLDQGYLGRLREKFAKLPPSSLALMVERAPPDLQPYFAVLDREAKEGKLWPQGP
jgi:hypothetical protein